MKVLWMSKRKVGAASTLGLVFALLVAVPLHPAWLIEGLARHSPEVLYFVETARPLVALTIDDGPDPVHAMLSELRTLPKEVRRKTILYHFGDRWDDEAYAFVAVEFAGFAQPRHRYMLFD